MDNLDELVTRYVSNKIGLRCGRLKWPLKTGFEKLPSYDSNKLKSGQWNFDHMDYKLATFPACCEPTLSKLRRFNSHKITYDFANVTCHSLWAKVEMNTIIRDHPWCQNWKYKSSALDSVGIEISSNAIIRAGACMRFISAGEQQHSKMENMMTHFIHLLK
ncbi:hypothetical protein Ancab_026129 [Ancistrocladus abbreviatus]